MRSFIMGVRFAHVSGRPDTSRTASLFRASMRSIVTSPTSEIAGPWILMRVGSDCHRPASRAGVLPTWCIVGAASSQGLPSDLPITSFWRDELEASAAPNEPKSGTGARLASRRAELGKEGEGVIEVDAGLLVPIVL